jgi:hypothetical protein
MKFKLGSPTDLEELSQNEDWNELENISSFFIFKILILGFAILNSIGGAGDIFYSILVFSQVPKNSVVKTDTARVFWKKR